MMDAHTNTPKLADLDEVDQKIFEALRQDGRTPFSQIAEQLDVSPGMIRMRYNRLVDMGLLKVVAITNPLRLGYDAMAMIGIRTDGKKCLRLQRRLLVLKKWSILWLPVGDMTSWLKYSAGITRICFDFSRRNFTA